jgi:L-ascorbate metabolism protein UlaG (beta-lactamase superfamily)
MGFIVEAGPGIRIYHPGDTAITLDMQTWGQLYRPTVGLMHVALPEGSLPHFEAYKCGELTVQEALLASQWLGLEHIVASHYATPDAEDVKLFRELVEASSAAGGYRPRLSVLKPGEVLEL